MIYSSSSESKPNGFPFDIPAMKARLPLPALLELLGFGADSRHWNFCPFHENTNTGAFSVYRKKGGWKWKCHSQCGGGDEIDFIEHLEMCSRYEAMARYDQLSGTYRTSRCVLTESRMTPRAITPCANLSYPDDLHKGCRAELDAVAQLRKVDFWAVATMQQNGVLQFGTVCGFPCWIVTDASRNIAEARRLDGLIFPSVGSLGERKVHTLKGSSKAWPVGLALPNNLHEYFPKVLLLEGSGDFVAGYHFAMSCAEGQRWLPVAMLGAKCRIAEDANRLLRGKFVRLIPHCDNAGFNAAADWKLWLMESGIDGDVFDLSGLRRSDGSPVKDLGDCTDLHPEDRNELEELLNER